MNYPQPYGYPVPPVHTQVLVHPYRCSTFHVVIAWVLAVVSGFYLLPWAVSATRNRTNVGATALVNLFLGWTLVGWIVALVMACGSERPVVVVQHTYAAPLPPWPQEQWTQTAPLELTMVDPFGNEPTQALPRSPWEPDHRR